MFNHILYLNLDYLINNLLHFEIFLDLYVQTAKKQKAKGKRKTPAWIYFLLKLRSQSYDGKNVSLFFNSDKQKVFVACMPVVLKKN